MFVKKRLVSILVIFIQLISLFWFVQITKAEDLPDLIVTDISWQPENPQKGDKVLFSVTIKNIGTAPTPSDVIHGVGFHIDEDYSRFWWTDNFKGPLAPGQEITLTVTGGQGGSNRDQPTWDAVPGQHKVWAFVDDAERISESDDNNNVLGKDIFVEGALEGPKIVLIKSAWTGQYVYQAGDRLEYTYDIQPNDARAQWIIEDFNGSKMIKNRATYNYIHIENYDTKQYVECGNVDDSWYSSRWNIIENNGKVMIESVFKQNQYLNIEGNPGVVKLSEVYPEWDSAKWIFEDVDPSAQVNMPLPDLIIEDLMWEPENPVEGNTLLFSVKVKNIGEGAVKEGEQIAAGFNVDGKEPWFWTDLYTNGLPVGASIILPVIGGSAGKFWQAKSGLHTLFCNVDDYDPDPNDDKIGRVKESNENNNSFHKRLPYIEKSQQQQKTELPNICGAIYVGNKLNIAQEIYHGQQQAENRIRTVRESFNKLKAHDNVNDELLDLLAKYQIEKVVVGSKNPQNTQNSKFGLYWDEKNLYGVVRVYDAAKRKDAPDPSQIWNNDSVEIYLDMDRNKEDSYTSDDFQYFFGWNYSTPMEFKHNAIANVTFNQFDFEDGYAMLITIPWSTVGVTNISKNMAFGFDIAVDDNYGNQTRGAQMIWNSKDDQAWQYPNRLGDCQLVLGLGVPKQLPLPNQNIVGKPVAPPYTPPQGVGATLPWIELEAENANTNGNVIGPSFEVNDEPSEASGRKFVRLDRTGEYVEFTVPQNSNAIVLRYSIPDSEDGKGIDATLSLYVNNEFRTKLNMTSRYNWVYGAYPWTNDPSFGAPRYYFDEVRLLLGSLNAGDKVKLQVDQDDNSPYYDIDLIDFENVAAPSEKPDGFLSITDFGAIPNDGKDDTQAIYDCINTAKAQNMGVWIPAGKFEKLNGPVVESAYSGFSGSGYVAGFNVVGATEKINIFGIPQTEQYSIEIRYSNATDKNQTLSFMINGQMNKVEFEPTGSFDNWATKTIEVPLNEGRNLLQVIHFYEDTGDILLDYIKVNNTKYEAEDGYLTCPIYVDNVTLKGAGMWYSTITGPFSQFVLMGNNCKFYDFAIFGQTNTRIDELDDNAFAGWGGTGSVLENIWIEHKKCGFWVGNSKYGRTNGLVIRNCRFRNLMADGVNLCDGTINSIIENCHARNTGDDAFAIWSAIYNQNIWGCENNIIRNNTIQQPWLAQGVAIYGGSGNVAENNLIMDVPTSAGILISTTFDCVPFSGKTIIRNNSIVRCGEPSGKMGAFRVMCDKQDIQGLEVSNLELYDCTDVGIRFMGKMNIVNAVFDSIKINYCGAYGIYASGETKGSATFKNVRIDNTALDKVQIETPNLTIQKFEENNW